MPAHMVKTNLEWGDANDVERQTNRTGSRKTYSSQWGVRDETRGSRDRLAPMRCQYRKSVHIIAVLIIASLSRPNTWYDARCNVATGPGGCRMMSITNQAWYDNIQIVTDARKERAADWKRRWRAIMQWSSAQNRIVKDASETCAANSSESRHEIHKKRSAPGATAGQRKPNPERT